MKYIKKFETYSINEAKIDNVLARQIAEDLFPQFIERQKKGEKITPIVFEEFIKERGLDSYSSDLILSELVEMGFDFDMSDSDWNSDEKEIEPGDFVNFEKHGLLYVVSILGDGYLVSKDENQRYEGDNGDGFIIPLGEDGTIIEKG